MKAQSFIISLFIILITNVVSSQHANLQKIEEKLQQYFEFERNAYSVHFNKKSYIPGETIWLKGNVIQRKNGLPDPNVVNIHANIYDQNGNLIDDLLLYAAGGYFYGFYPIKEKAQPGKWTIQFYTNYQNNFFEDESSLYELNILAEKDEELDTLNGLDLTFAPESGLLLHDVLNTISVRAVDKNGKPVSHVSIVIKNNKNEVLQNTATNLQGYAKFDLNPKFNETYRAYVKDEFSESEILLPKAIQSGISMSVNNYGLKNKCVVKLKTNTLSIESLKNRKYYLLIHQDDKALILEKDFSNGQLEQTLVIPQNDLFNGINTIRLLDENLTEVAVRQIYKYPEYINEMPLVSQKASKKQTLEFNSKVNAHLSMSVLPEQTQALFDTHNILGEVTINPYLKDRKSGLPYYFTGNQIQKQLELDNMLIHETTPKYSWVSIMNRKVTERHLPDYGLSIKGNIPMKITDIERHKMQLYSFQYSLNLFNDLGKNNDFEFHNIILTDTSSVTLQLFKDMKQKLPTKPSVRITNRERTFIHAFKPQVNENLIPFIVKRKDDELNRPKFDKKYDIVFDGVEIKEYSRPKLTREKGINSMLQGEKITEDTPMRENNILYFLERKGFLVRYNLGEPPFLSTRYASTNSINGATSNVLVLVDGVQIWDLEMLRDMFLGDIDEIYWSTTAMEPSIRNFYGKVSIYTKTGFASNQTKEKTATAFEFNVTKGFQKIRPFKNKTYLSTTDYGFQNFGIHYWTPFIESNEKGLVAEIERLNDEPLRLQIQGIDMEGKLYYIDTKVE
jgi:hypothetical protein